MGPKSLARTRYYKRCVINDRKYAVFSKETLIVKRASGVRLKCFWSFEHTLYPYLLSKPNRWVQRNNRQHVRWYAVFLYTDRKSVSRLSQIRISNDCSFVRNRVLKVDMKNKDSSSLNRSREVTDRP